MTGSHLNEVTLRTAKQRDKNIYLAFLNTLHFKIIKQLMRGSSSLRIST